MWEKTTSLGYMWLGSECELTITAITMANGKIAFHASRIGPVALQGDYMMTILDCEGNCVVSTTHHYDVRIPHSAVMTYVYELTIAEIFNDSGEGVLHVKF